MNLRQSSRAFLCSLLVGMGAATAIGPAAIASSTAHTTPEHVLVNSDMIFQGTVLAAVPGWTDARHVFATTDYTIRVDRVLLDRDGTLAARTLGGVTVLSFAGGTQQGITYSVSGVPELAVGQEAFFCMSAADIGAMSPIVGISAGLFPVVWNNGAPIVNTAGGCSGPPRPVNFRFFAKFAMPGVTYTPDEFAEEIVRALPLAAASPELRFSTQPIPAQFQGRAFTGEELVNSVALAGSQPPAGPSTSAIAPHSGYVKPAAPQERTFSDATLELIERQNLEFGYFSGSPLPPVIFNVPPGTTWRDAFIGQQGAWNRHSSDFFQFYVNSNNQIGWPNGRHETAFLNQAQMTALYGFTWSANTLAVCLSRSDGSPRRIIEADIAFNPAHSFTADPNVTYANGNMFYIQQVALHELGHAFARAHQWDSDPSTSVPSTMNYFTNGFFQAEAGRVFADDAESIRALIPSSPVSQSDFGIMMWRMSGARSGGDPSYNTTTNLHLATSVRQGEFFSVYDAYLENVGTVTRATTIDWYLDPTPHDYNLSGAYYCSSTSLGTLNRNSGVAISTFVQASQTIPPGNYYLCAVLAEDDALVDNDFAWSRDTIRVDHNPSFGPPANDSQNSPRSIGLGTVTGSTQFATNDGTASCGSSNASKDVWFTLVVPYAGSFEADTCGSGYDTVLSVARRQINPVTGGITFVELNCNDDAVGGDCSGTTRSRVFINSVSAGDLLRLRLGGFLTASGNYTLTTRVYPNNDFCANAVPVTAGAYTATLAGATNDQTGSCGQSQTTADVWFRYTWPTGCNTVSFNTTGSNFDTVLEVFNVCSPFAIPRGCNDDCGPVGPSCLTITRGAEAFLRIRVTRYGGTPPAGNSIVLNVSTPVGAHDVCSGAMPLPDGDYSFNNSCGNADALPMPSSCGSSEAVNDFWFRYTAPISGQLQVVVDTPFPAAVALYPGFACPGDPEQAIGCAIGFEGVLGAPGATLVADVSAGETFLIRMGGSVQPGFGVPIGTGTFSFHTVQAAPANDNALAGDPVGAGQFIQANLSLASADGSSSSDRVPGGPDVWFAFSAPADGPLVARTCGTLNTSGLDTVVSVHALDDEGNLIEIVSSDTSDPAGCPEGTPLPDPEDATIALSVAGGRTYYIRVAATDPALVGTGDFNLSIEFSSLADACSTPVELVDGDSLVTTSAAAPDGPADSCFGGDEPDVWFAYTATCTGTLSVTACGAPFDTVRIGLYDASLGCPSGEGLACGVSTGLDCESGAAASAAAVAGQVFLIRYSSFLTEASTLTIACTPGTPTCPADFNADGFVNPDDLADFITCFFLDILFPGFCPAADFNADEFRNPDDLADFITTFFLSVQFGC